MNKDRRKKLDDVISKMEDLKEALEDSRNSIDTAKENFEEAKSILEAARDDETEYHDNMPESMQQGDKGSKAEEAIAELDAAVQACDDIDLDAMISSLDDIISNCENAKGL